MQLGYINKVDAATRQLQHVPVFNDQRFSHSWVIGKTGVGKSTALVRWAIDDILAGDGLAFFDPHGDTAEELLRRMPPERLEDVVYFNPAEFAIGFNIFDTIPEERKAFLASSLVDSLKSVWGYSDMATPVLSQFLYNGARAMMDVPGGTLLGMKFLLTSKRYRERVLRHIKDPTIADFWRVDFEEHMPEREQRQQTLSTLNKIGALISDPSIRACIGQPKSRLNLSAIMDEGKILIVSLPQGALGIEKSAMIGSLIMSQLHLAALTRGVNRNPFHIYADECHHFGAATLAEMLSGIRKFGVSLILAHQYIDQLPDKLRSALIGTAGTIVSFRIGALDVPFIEPEFHLTNSDFSLCELQPFTAYARTGFQTWRMSMPECDAPERPALARKIKNYSRSQYGSDRALVENRIARFIANT